VSQSKRRDKGEEKGIERKQQGRNSQEEGRVCRKEGMKDTPPAMQIRRMQWRKMRQGRRRKESRPPGVKLYASTTTKSNHFRVEPPSDASLPICQKLISAGLIRHESHRIGRITFLPLGRSSGRIRRGNKGTLFYSTAGQGSICRPRSDLNSS
jgi:hypothetical protein